MDRKPDVFLLKLDIEHALNVVLLVPEKRTQGVFERHPKGLPCFTVLGILVWFKKRTRLFSATKPSAVLQIKTCMRWGTATAR